MATTSLTSWFGSNRTLAPAVGVEMGKLHWAGVPFVGSYTEVAQIQARTILCNDLHPHLQNLAAVTSHPVLGPKLYRHVRRLAFHPATLQRAVDNCAHREDSHVNFESPDLIWAAAYFTISWMGRSSIAGKKNEFDTKLAVRWNSGGGDSVVRWNSAGRGLMEWRKVLQRCGFTCMDAFKFIERCEDKDDSCERHGLYLDPPFDGPGAVYKFTFGDAGHARLADLLSKFNHNRIVIRYYDTPLIRKLYPADRWNWRFMDGGRKQSNKSAPEVLILNGNSYAATSAAA